MAAMPIYGKSPSKIFFSGTGGPISMKLGMKYYNVYINHDSGTGGPISMKLGMKYYNVYINHDSVMTLTYFTARST